MKGMLRAAAVAAAFVLTAAGSTIPRPAPALEFIASNGNKVSLKELRGKAVVIEFLLTTCPHCQNTSRILSQLQNEFGPHGLQVIGVAINANAGEQLPMFTNQYARTFPVGIKDESVARDFLQVSPVMRMLMPQIAFIDRAGIIKEQHSGDEEAYFGDQEGNLRKSIERIMGAGKPQPRLKTTHTAAVKK